MPDTKKVACSNCGAKTEISAPGDDAWEGVDHERVSTTNPDGSTGVEKLPTKERVVWLCDSCGESNEITREVQS